MLQMDSAFKHIILENKDYLSKRIDLLKIRPLLEKYGIFTLAMLEDIYNFSSDYDFYMELITRGPDAFEKFGKVLKEAEYFKEAQIFEPNSLSVPILRKRPCYKMNSKPFVGHCFIINNVEFTNHTYRYGSDLDAKALCHLFQKLGYNVECERNLEAKQMLDYLQKFRDKDWYTVDSLVLFILSHGDNSNNLDIIYGSDSKYVNKTDIYEMFDNVNCEPLKFKPKIFFFQACRGDGKDHGVWSTISSDASKIVKLPTMSNMLAVHSALPNHVSYRDHDRGTWFCQDLIEVFSSDYLTQDVETMLKTVAHKLESRLALNQCKQILHIDQFGFKAYVYFSMENVADYCEIYDPKSAFII